MMPETEHQVSTTSPVTVTLVAAAPEGTAVETSKATASPAQEIQDSFMSLALPTAGCRVDKLKEGQGRNKSIHRHVCLNPARARAYASCGAVRKPHEAR